MANSGLCNFRAGFTALPEVRATIKLEAPHSFDLRDSGDYRRAARDSFGESFQIEVTKMS
jgi:hypothetical protein